MHKIRPWKWQLMTKIAAYRGKQATAGLYKDSKIFLQETLDIRRDIWYTMDVLERDAPHKRQKPDGQTDSTRGWSHRVSGRERAARKVAKKSKKILRNPLTKDKTYDIL